MLEVFTKQLRRRKPFQAQEIELKNKGTLLCKLSFAVIGGTLASTATARVVQELPEPSVLSLIGVAVVGGIVVFRLTRKK